MEGEVLEILLFGLLLCSGATCEAKRREYFIAMEEIVWEYKGPKAGHPFASKISKYKKAVFREYTDATFTVKSDRPPGLGLYGPILRAEVKDILVVHAWNRASRPYSVHPHGVFYLKNSEGALYTDNTTNANKVDDAIPPGDSHTYIWEVRDEYGPGPDDLNCLPWAYHSHVDSMKDQNSGLIGTILTCRKGTLSDDGLRTDVDREFPMIGFAIDENESWYIDENIQNYAANPESIDRGDHAFITGNMKYSLNGQTWNGLSGLEMCEGDLVHWYMIGLGSEPHTLQFVGNTVTTDGHRMDTAILMPATFSTAVMKADNPGTWRLVCHYTKHTKLGMLVNYEIQDNCGTSMGAVEKEKMNGELRKYYVAAEETEWNFSPTGINVVTHRPVEEDGQTSTKFFKRGPDRIGGTYIKAVYRGYTDETFLHKSNPNPVLDIMGPLIAAEVGDTIEVYFKNNASMSYTIEPHGVYSENIDLGVEPGSIRKYVWRVPPSVSPTDKDKNCVPYMYTSRVGSDQNSGLIGPMLVCKKGTLAAELAKPPHFILLTTYDENVSPYLRRNIKKFTSDPSSVNIKDEGFRESNRMRTVNGLSYGSYNGLEICAGEDTDIYVIAIGGDINTHSLMVDGIVVKHRTEYVGAIGVLPHAVATITIRVDDPGLGFLACHIVNHGANGMISFFQVNNCGIMRPKFIPSKKRKFYLGAVEQTWDYLPNRTDYKGHSVDDVDHPSYLVARQEDGKFIGSKYKKAIFYEYTDETFTVRKPKPAHFGFHGPLLKMEIGDEVEVVFKNMATRPYTAFAFALYRVRASKGPIPPVQPGEIRTYRWQARPEITPSDDQPDCISTKYVSFADFYDTTAGLHGPILVCKKGTLELGKGGGADQEFFLYFNINDENLSYYLDDNIREFAKADPKTFDKKNKDFVESNQMNHINGLMYHVPGISMKRGELVRWHLFAEGEEEVHTVHFHANNLVHQSDKENRNDVFPLIAGTDITVLMRPDAVGEWLLHCHVNTHANIGMITTYTVTEGTATCKPLCKTCTIRLDCSLLGIKNSADLLNENSEVRILRNKEILYVPSHRVMQLDLSGNTNLGDVEELKILLSNFPNLIVLKLNSINLKELPRAFVFGLKKLKLLYVQDNKIQKLDEEYVNGKGKLRVLDLRRNDLRRISFDMSIGESWTKLKRLDLRENPNLHPPCLSKIHKSFASVRACYQLYEDEE